MNFEEAMRALRSGHKVKRQSNQGLKLETKIVDADREVVENLDSDDLLAQDWIVVHDSATGDC